MTVEDEIGRGLRHLIGHAQSLDAVNSTLKSVVRNSGLRTVGAFHITCSDETEHEATRSFDETFARDLLPRLKFGHHAPFRSANLGGRYEWGAVRLAENHFAPPVADGAGKALVVKVTAHVGCSSRRRRATHDSKPTPRFGVLDRYGEESPCCGLLAAALAGDPLPAAAEMREALRSEGIDRVAALHNQVDDHHRALAAAIVAARIQARQVVIDLQDFRPASPTLHLIVPTVTVNRRDRDRELVCGLYLVDQRGSATVGTYEGLSDRPEKLEIEERHGVLRVSDPTMTTQRPIRDHRAMIGAAYKRALDETTRPRIAGDRRIQEIARSRQAAHRRPAETAAKPVTVRHGIEKTGLRALLLVLAEIAPVPTALFLFGEGAAGMFHAWRAHRVATDPSRTDDARAIVDELEQRLDRLPPEQASQLLDTLLAEITSSRG